MLRCLEAVAVGVVAGVVIAAVVGYWALLYGSDDVLASW